jgi:hypothetical protein
MLEKKSDDLIFVNGQPVFILENGQYRQAKKSDKLKTMWDVLKEEGIF